MIKDCEVVLNNSAVTVIRDGAHDIQLPSIKREAVKIRVLIDNGKYTVVDDDYTEQSNIVEKPIDKNRKALQRKTTVEEKKEETSESNKDKIV